MQRICVPTISYISGDFDGVRMSIQCFHFNRDQRSIHLIAHDLYLLCFKNCILQKKTHSQQPTCHNDYKSARHLTVPAEFSITKCQIDFVLFSSQLRGEELKPIGGNSVASILDSFTCIHTPSQILPERSRWKGYKGFCRKLRFVVKRQQSWLVRASFITVQVKLDLLTFCLA